MRIVLVPNRGVEIGREFATRNYADFYDRVADLRIQRERPSTLVAFTSDQQEDPHAQNHVAVERPVLVGQPDHLRKHPSAVSGPGGPIRRRASNGVPTSRRRRLRQRGAARGRGRDLISVPHVGADRGCIFRRPSTTLSAYSSTVLRQGTAPDQGTLDDDGDGDEG